MKESNDNLRRLRWKCRRGMLELDVFLAPFVEHHFQNLSPQEQALFERLLDESDPDLYAWILGQTTPSNPDYLPLIEKIRG